MIPKTATVVLLLASVLALAAVACTSTPASDTGRGPATDTLATGTPAVPRKTPPPASDPAPGSDRVREPAPIESVQIEVTSGTVPRNDLLVASGLPNGCYELDGYELTREGETISVEVTNSRPADRNIACTDIYRVVETTIPLGDDIEACKVYTVEVNGVPFQVQAIGRFYKVGPSPKPASTPALFTVVPAPIDGIKIEIAESFPPQYFLVVESGLPDSCVKFDRYEVERHGRTLDVKVTNLQPADKTLLCMQVYGTVESRIALGTDFEPGEVYVAQVNDSTFSFMAQGPVDPSAEPGPFRVGIGQTVTIEFENLAINFSEVVEDPRCALNIVCLWEGRAIIRVELASSGKPVGVTELTLQPGSPFPTGPAPAQIGEYLVTLLALDPYPGSVGPPDSGRLPDYVATLTVLKAPLGLDQAKIHLRTARSMQPLTVQFMAEIAGGPDNSFDLYCHGWEWQFGDGTVNAISPGCTPWTADATFPRHFEETYTYEGPGTYEVTFSYGPLTSEPLRVDLR